MVQQDKTCMESVWKSNGMNELNDINASEQHWRVNIVGFMQDGIKWYMSAVFYHFEWIKLYIVHCTAFRSITF